MHVLGSQSLTQISTKLEREERGGGGSSTSPTWLNIGACRAAAPVLLSLAVNTCKQAIFLNERLAGSACSLGPTRGFPYDVQKRNGRTSSGRGHSRARRGPAWHTAPPGSGRRAGRMAQLAARSTSSPGETKFLAQAPQQLPFLFLFHPFQELSPPQVPK